MRRISPASHPKNSSRFCNAQGHTPATLACLPRHKLLSDRIYRQQKLRPPQLISTSNPVFFSLTLRIFSLNAVLATLESCQLLKYYFTSNYLYLELYSKCADLKNTTFFHLHAVILPSAGFTPAIVKSCSALGVSLLTKHFKYTVAETVMSRPVGIFAALELFLHDYRSQKIHIWTPIKDITRFHYQQPGNHSIIDQIFFF